MVQWNYVLAIVCHIEVKTKCDLECAVDNFNAAPQVCTFFLTVNTEEDIDVNCSLWRGVSLSEFVCDLTLK